MPLSQEKEKRQTFLEQPENDGVVVVKKRVYSKPALSDLAMAYRNYQAEVDFMFPMHPSYAVGTTTERPATLVSWGGRIATRLLQLLPGVVCQDSIRGFLGINSEAWTEKCPIYFPQAFPQSRY